MESLIVGLRVVRGPDWEWGASDGGEGHVGTVVEVEDPMNGGRPVIVQWDSGYRCRYRCGVGGKYDLRVLDSAPTGLCHRHVDCTWCGEVSVRGMLWRCAQCVDYNLCTPCYNAGKHIVDHKFNRFDTTDLTKRVGVPLRYSSPRMIPRGIFPGAEVNRGHDWKWDDQDGGDGVIGRVINIEGWEGETLRSVVEVQWRGSKVKNVYRLSHKGKVDLKYTKPAVGGFYYPDHLPVLGAPVVENQCLCAGDTAQVQLDPDLFKIAQQDHGGWNDAMAEFIGRKCVVHALHGTGNAVVRYSNNRVFLFNADTLTKVDIPLFRIGQVVRVIEDMVKVHDLQIGHPGWNDDMTLALGQLGHVLHVQPSSEVRVLVKGQRWLFKPECLRSAPGETIPEYTADDIVVNVGVKIELLSLMEAKCPDVLGSAAAAGDVGTLNSYLRKNPLEINTKVDGSGLLQVAIKEGFKPVVEALLTHNPDLELEDDTGERPLHMCAYCNNSAAAKLLVLAGANVNATNDVGASPITLASSQGHYEVLEAFLQHPHANLNFQDVEGRTPLHRTVFTHHRRTMRMLLEYGGDPTLVTFNLFSVIHEAASLWFTAGMEELLRYHPELINLKKENGSTPLHVAAANNHFDVVSLLCSHPSCNVNVQNNGRLSPLHIAVHEGHVQSIERLVGFGADVNAIAGDGSTPLHLAFGKKNMNPPDKDTPFLLKIQEEIEQAHGKGVLSLNVIVGIFLVIAGADLHPKNQMGASPLKILPVDVASLVLNYKGRTDSFHGSFKQLIRPFQNELPKPIKPRNKIHSAPVMSPPMTNEASNLQRPNSEMGKVTQSLTGGLVMVNPRRNDIKCHSGVGGNKPEIMEQNKQNNISLSSSQATAAAVSSSEIVTCCLCEKGADIKLLPCGHVALCHNCVGSGQGAKKCPQMDCRKSLERYVPVCVFCKRDSSLLLYSPCRHSVCTSCKLQSEHCTACQLLADD